MKRRYLPAWLALPVALAGIGLAGCSDYMDRKNTIAFNTGEAVQTNIVTQVTDPWPAHARYKEIGFSGERMARTVRRYELGPGSNGGASSAAGGGATGTQQ